jgi:predicted O-linked N-acetylglucosamine transferase (SPINDLY family)
MAKFPSNTPRDSPAQQGLDSKEIFEQARDFFTAGRYNEALRRLTTLHSDASYSVKASCNIASCLLMMGMIRPGMKFIDRALQQDPTYVPALLNRAKALQAQQQFEEVLPVCQRIVELSAQEEEGWQLYITALQATDQNALALEVTSHWLEALPGSFKALMVEAELLSNAGKEQQAIKSLETALRINPQSDAVYSCLSIVMLRLGKHEVALGYADKALDLIPDSPSYLAYKGYLLQLMGLRKEGAECYQRASSLRPESAILFLNRYFTLPAIPGCTQEIEEARIHFKEGLSLAEKDDSLQLTLQDLTISHTFALAYHNKNDLTLLERYNNLMRRLAIPLLREYRQLHASSGLITKLKDRNRIRIGFISAFFQSHSNTFAFEGLIRYLDRQRFEVVLIHTAASEKDSMRDDLDAVCEQTIQLTSSYSDAYQTLHTLNLDILFFTDLGINPYEYLLPFFRSAPIQMTGWGIPHTSGINEIDYYVSTEQLELPGSDSFYTETLVKLPGSLPCCFLGNDLKFTPLPREYFLLPPTEILAGCLQSLHKIHPDYDSVLEKIAKQNPDLVFVFVEDRIATRTKLFLDRLARTAPTVCDRCMTLALMKRKEYHALCNCIDFLLDPIYYGSGITFFEASLVGTPIITLEGSNLRSRVVACGYREMDIEDVPIARSIDEYVDLATQLANDPDRRARMKASILENKHQIFNRMDYVRNFEDFCIKAVSRSRQKSQRPQ